MVKASTLTVIVGNDKTNLEMLNFIAKSRIANADTLWAVAHNNKADAGTLTTVAGNRSADLKTLKFIVDSGKADNETLWAVANNKNNTDISMLKAIAVKFDLSTESEQLYDRIKQLESKIQGLEPVGAGLEM